MIKAHGVTLDPSPELPDNTAIADLNLPTRIRNALLAGDMSTIGDVREASDKALLNLQDIGSESVAYLREAFGLSSSEGVRPSKKP